MTDAELVRRGLEKIRQAGLKNDWVERQIGLSRGYLSRIQRGVAKPRRPLCCLLYAVGMQADPRGWLRELSGIGLYRPGRPAIAHA